MKVRAAVIVVALGLCLVVCVRATNAARAGAERSLRRLERITADAAELARLRAEAPKVAAGKRPEPGIAGQISDTLAEAGVAVTVLKDLLPDADRPGSSPGEKRQSARFTLEPMSLRDVGRFLGAWRSRHPEWTVSFIQLAPQPGDKTSPANSPPLQCRLVIETVFFERSVFSEKAQ